MPLVLAFAIIAIAVAFGLRSGRGTGGQGGRFIGGTAAALWLGMIVLAVIVLTVATLVFGR